MRREFAYLDDILECIERLEEYLAGVDETAFLMNRLLQDAVVHNLQIIGEAVKSLPETVKQRQPQIAWREIARMRDKMVLPLNLMSCGSDTGYCNSESRGHGIAQRTRTITPENILEEQSLLC